MEGYVLGYRSLPTWLNLIALWLTNTPAPISGSRIVAAFRTTELNDSKPMMRFAKREKPITTTDYI